MPTNFRQQCRSQIMSIARRKGQVSLFELTNEIQAQHGPKATKEAIRKIADDLVNEGRLEFAADRLYKIP